MFDGSYRTQRRVVNLGSSTSNNRKRNKTAQDRTSILEKSRLLREQRYAEQKQAKASIVIQRRVRGNHVRRCVSQQWRNQIVEMITSFVEKVDDGQLNSDDCIDISEKITFLFNAWLRLNLQPSRRMNPSSNGRSQKLLVVNDQRNKEVQQLLFLYSTFVQKIKRIGQSSKGSTVKSSLQESNKYGRPPPLLIAQATLEQIRENYLRRETTASYGTAGIVIDSRLPDESLIQILLHVLQIPPRDHLDASTSNEKTEGTTNGTFTPRFSFKNPDTSTFEGILLSLVETYSMVFDRILMSLTEATQQRNPDQSMLIYLYHCTSTILTALDNTLSYRALRGALLLIEPSTAIYRKDEQPLERKEKFQQFLPDILYVLRPNRRTFNESISSYNETYKNVSLPKEISNAVHHLIGKYGILTMQRYLVDDIIPLTNSLHRSVVSLKDGAKLAGSSQVYEMSLWMQYMKCILMDVSFDSAIIQSSSEFVGSTRLRLLWMIQCMVRGDTLRSSSNAKNLHGPLPSADDINDDDSLDDDDLGTRQPTTAVIRNSESLSQNETVAPSAFAAKTNRISKADLQTVPKLDRLYADIIRKVDVLVASKSPSSVQNSAMCLVTDETLASLAKQFADASLLLKWGIILLTPVDDDDDDFIVRDRDMEFLTMLRYGQDDFICLCFVFLQATTGLRLQQNATTSAALNTLAFSLPFIQLLWKYILRQRFITSFSLQHASIRDVFLAPQAFLTYPAANEAFYYSIALFSDLFSHHLIVMKDEKFLSDFTTIRSPFAGFKPSVSIEDIIQLFKTVLHELYWSKPVCKIDFRLILGKAERGLFFNSNNLSQFIAKSDDDCMATVRARLLLTGTKLWNSIYERWCRLYSYSRFCDESVWWFPSVTSSSSVINDTLVSSNPGSERPANERRRNSTRSMEDNDDAMDIDSVSSFEDNPDTASSHRDGDGDLLAAIFLDPKMARVLASIPQALPFEQRVKIFDSLLRADKVKSQNDASELRHFMVAMMRDQDTAEIPGRETVHVRRTELYQDSMDQLNELGSKLKRRVQVTFTNQHGTQEAGIDGGGVFKEFIDDLIKDAFSVGSSTRPFPLFTATPFQTLTVNTSLPDEGDLLVHYEFLGRVLGKAVYESILVEPQFCLPFLNQLLGRSSSVEDLKNLDLEYYSNLTKLFDMSAAEIQGLDLSFEMTIMTDSVVRTIELIPGGRSIPVSKSNVIQYVHLVSHQRLNVLTARQTRAFLRGFRDLIPASWVRLFSAYELQKVISGDDSVRGIDVASLKRSMQYAAGYHPDQPIIQSFWEIIEEMNPDQQRKFLKFMTSCSRQPLLGFGSLEPAPCIQQIRLPDALFEMRDEREVGKVAPLPTSSTCMNLLKLPNYRGKELMRQKLLAAIESGAGFELT